MHCYSHDPEVLNGARINLIRLVECDAPQFQTLFPYSRSTHLARMRMLPSRKARRGAKKCRELQTDPTHAPGSYRIVNCQLEVLSDELEWTPLPRSPANEADRTVVNWGS